MYTDIKILLFVALVFAIGVAAFPSVGRRDRTMVMLGAVVGVLAAIYLFDSITRDLRAIAAAERAASASKSSLAGVRVRIVGKNPTRDFILAYDGGECFFAHPKRLAASSARVETLAQKEALPRVVAFDAAFRKTQGFEARIDLRLVEPAQCPVVDALRATRGSVVDGNWNIKLATDLPKVEQEIAFFVGGRQVERAFLYDRQGRAIDLSGAMKQFADGTSFVVPGQPDPGPEIILVARGAGARFSPDMDFNGLLAAIRAGKARVALHYLNRKR